MKALLMHPDRDLDLTRPLPAHAQALSQDLELHTLLRAMSGQDPFLFDVAQRVLLTGLSNDVETILYRQDILKDCLEHPQVIRQLYALAVQTIEDKRNYFISVISNYPSGTLYDGIRAIEYFADRLQKLRAIADQHCGQFESHGLSNLFAMLRSQFSDEYLASIQAHLKELRFRRGVLISAELGRGNEGANFVLRRPKGPSPNWLRRLLEKLPGMGPPGYTFRLADRDETGARILSAMRDRGINLVANAVGQSADHILSFFTMLRTELAFYIGCLNLRDALASRGVPTTLPQPYPAGTRRLSFKALRDVCLVLAMPGPVVANDLMADAKSLLVITGANQGGKSSFMRGVGLAQLMMQCGMFVAAESFAAELCPNLFTHYRREEDATMTSGKLDEELSRMSNIVGAIQPDAMLLCNESFASTNEREGSEIARQVITALVERRVKVLFVTHLYDFAQSLAARARPDAMFLRAERLPDGSRTFRLVEGPPLETSFGEDLYERVFAGDDGQPSAT
ncbi:MutS-related protein [Fontivita pretiosa]|uniref:MutS-related protein n=1 Tax=Fontivita pretiosa TaxID=2989684 RepID=UPI003D16B7D6